MRVIPADDFDAEASGNSASGRYVESGEGGQYTRQRGAPYGMFRTFTFAKSHHLPWFRAFDVETGKEIWEAELPAPGGATPMTYRTREGGKQFLVIAAGGHPGVDEEKQSDAIIAFALP